MKDPLTSILDGEVGLDDEEKALAIIALAITPTQSRPKHNSEGTPEQELAALEAVYKQIGELDGEEASISPRLFYLLVSEMKRRSLAVSMPDSSMMAMAGLGGGGLF